MTILYDHQTFSIQKFGGISRYFVELIKGVNQESRYKSFLSLCISNNIHLKEANLDVTLPTFLPKLLQKQSVIYRLNQHLCKLNLLTRHYDLVHATYFDPYFLQYLKGKPFVITVHDMIYEKLGSQFQELGSDVKIIERKRELVKRAARVIAVSESTKKDLIEVLNVDPDKIDVVYHGSSFIPKERDKSSYTNSYLLFVGNRGHYKNFSGLLRAVAILLPNYNLRLICAGGGSFTLHEQNIIQELKVSKYIKQQHIDSDETLRILYESALAFVFPSLYEGFGIPILEAFACRCPCVLSNVSSLPEIGGEAALYFDPTDCESMEQTIEQIIVDVNLRRKLIQKGAERLSLFSWEHTISKTLKVYEQC